MLCGANNKRWVFDHLETLLVTALHLLNQLFSRLVVHLISITSTNVVTDPHTISLLYSDLSVNKAAKKGTVKI